MPIELSLSICKLIFDVLDGVFWNRRITYAPSQVENFFFSVDSALWHTQNVTDI